MKIEDWLIEEYIEERILKIEKQNERPIDAITNAKLDGMIVAYEDILEYLK